MKRHLWIIAAVAGAFVVGLGISSAQPQPGGNAQPAAGPSSKDKLSYGVGFFLAQEVSQGLEADGVQADLDLIVRGFTDGLKKNNPMMAKADLDRTLQAVHQEMQNRMVARLIKEEPEFKKLVDENSVRSREFLEKFSKKPGTKELVNGVQYRVIAAGDGKSPTEADTVTVSYTGTLADGRIFGQGREIDFTVADRKPAMQIILKAMRVGDRWEVAVPPDQAFGAAGDPPLIGPNEVIVLDVELVAVK